MIKTIIFALVLVLSVVFSFAVGYHAGRQNSITAMTKFLCDQHIEGSDVLGGEIVPVPQTK